MSPLARFERLATEKREGLMKAAAAEFSTHLFKEASLKRIAEQAGMSKAAIYYYFENKIDLFVTVFRYFDQSAGLSLDTITNTQDTPSFWAAITTLLESGAVVMAQNPNWLGMIRAFYQLPHEMRTLNELAAYFEEAYTEIGKLFMHGQSIDAVRSDLPLTVLVQLSMAINEPMEKWMLEIWDDVDGPGRQRLLATGIDLYRRLLQPKGIIL